MSIFVAQAIGFIAFALGVTAFYQKDDGKMRFFLFLQGIALGLHFFLLGAQTGAVMALFAAIRAGLSLFPWAKKLVPLIYALSVAITFMTYETWVDILPAIAGILGTTALFYLRGLPMRLTFFCGGWMWLTHNIVVGSIGPALMEVFMISTAAYRIFRMWKEPQYKKAEPSLPPEAVS